MNWLKVIYIIGFAYTVFIIFSSIYNIFSKKVNSKQKHYCKKCNELFIAPIREIDYIYCPYCQEPLDYYKKEEEN